QTHGVDVALLVLPHPFGVRGLGIVQRRFLADLAWDTAAPGVGVEVEAGFDIRRDLIAHIAADPDQPTVAVIAVAFFGLSRAGEEPVHCATRSTGARLGSDKAKAAGVDAGVELRGVVTRRRHEVDGASE